MVFIIAIVQVVCENRVLTISASSPIISEVSLQGGASRKFRRNRKDDFLKNKHTISKIWQAI